MSRRTKTRKKPVSRKKFKSASKKLRAVSRVPKQFVFGFIVVLVTVFGAYFFYYRNKSTVSVVNIPVSSPSSSELIRVPDVDESAERPVAPPFSITPPSPVQGDVVRIDIDPSRIRSLIWRGRVLQTFPYGDKVVALIGLGATEKVGLEKLTIIDTDGHEIAENITIRQRKVPVIDLGIPDSVGVTQTELLASLSENRAKVMESVRASPSAPFFSRSFGLALKNNSNITSAYGEVRKTGNEVIRHLGLDFAAPLGSAVSSINDGVVVRTYTDQVYGNSLLVDHGLGIVSLYLHLNEFKAGVGDRVKKGQVIGTVGSTGYSTAPHLHLSVKIGEVSVDPVSLTKTF